MLSHLTGPPRIGGIDCPYCISGAPASLAWTDESIRATLRGGRRKTRVRRLRGRVTLSWMLPRDLCATLLTELDQDEIVVDVRTRADDDPAWAQEQPLLMQVTSTLPSLADVRTEWGDLMVELETVATYAERPDVIVGGYYARRIDEQRTEIAPYDGATITDGPTRTIWFDGERFDLPILRIGPPAVAGLRATPTKLPSGLAAATLITKPYPNV